MTEAKIQHYVPRFLLKNFGFGKKSQVWVYDKKDGRSFQTNAKNVACENRFYDFDLDGQKLSLESGLSQIESKTKPVIEQILRDDSVAGIGAKGRDILALFLAIQLTRTKALREQWAEFPRMLREKFEAMEVQVAPGSQAESLIQDLPENQIKINITRIILKASTTFGPYFSNKIWFLAKTTKSDPFILGDNPISLQNHIDMEPYGNLGLAVRGIEIYLPLSSTRVLVMWCPSLANDIQAAADKIRRLPQNAVNAHLKNPAGILEMDSALQSGGTLAYEKMSVMNLNSLQVYHSERYLFSSKNDFALADKMIGDHPQIRSGQRPSVN
uniref:DUF4238 domain-containing protein n=1 Tax=Candidatus Kentrum sp. DK TaxID=2126562 RepID=A0A450SQD7_9GAMM|nr:MAG: Protein of unknown function (DUF4238) [Candidatus Kentron sp. DK]